MASKLIAPELATATSGCTCVVCSSCAAAGLGALSSSLRLIMLSSGASAAIYLFTGIKAEPLLRLAHTAGKHTRTTHKRLAVLRADPRERCSVTVYYSIRVPPASGQARGERMTSCSRAEAAAYRPPLLPRCEPALCCLS